MLAVRVAAILGILLLGGCAVGNTVDFRSQKPAVTVSTEKPVVVAVLDQRSFVLSGDKEPSFVGIRRGGFGNPFNISTRSGATLATEVASLVVEALKASGVSASAVPVAPNADAQKAQDAIASAKAERGLVVLVKQWKSDLYLNMEVDFDLTAVVLDAAGLELARSKVAGNDRLGAATFESEVSAAASAALKRKLEVLLNDPAIVAALQ